MGEEGIGVGALTDTASVYRLRVDLKNFDLERRHVSLRV
jgi:hypothetical protein